MASRGGGPRALGTDGNDFMHRENIAEHYRISANSKWWLRSLSFVHILAWQMMLFRLSASFFVLCGMRPPSLLQRLQFPAPALYEYLWLLSITATAFGLYAVRRNRRLVVRHCALGHVIFGLLPLLWGGYSMSGDLYKFVQSHDPGRLFLGQPVILIWSLFVFITVQLHMCILYHCSQLIKAWNPRQKKLQ